MNPSNYARAAALCAVVLVATTSQLLMGEPAHSAVVMLSSFGLPIETKALAILALLGTAHFVALHEAALIRRDRSNRA